MDNNKITIALLIAVEVAFGFSAFEPSVFTIRHFASQPQTRESIRIGEALAIGYSMLIALVAAIVIQSTLPIVFTIASCFAMVCVYEWALNNPENGVEVME